MQVALRYCSSAFYAAAFLPANSVFFNCSLLSYTFSDTMAIGQMHFFAKFIFFSIKNPATCRQASLRSQHADLPERLVKTFSVVFPARRISFSYTRGPPPNSFASTLRSCCVIINGCFAKNSASSSSASADFTSHSLSKYIIACCFCV